MKTKLLKSGTTTHHNTNFAPDLNQSGFFYQINKKQR
jgi:hypothetical protein